jgi:hypothetical protein
MHQASAVKGGRGVRDDRRGRITAIQSTFARANTAYPSLIVPRQPSFAPEYMAWSSDSQILYFRARDENNRAGFWSVPVSGGHRGIRIHHEEG